MHKLTNIIEALKAFVAPLTAAERREAGILSVEDARASRAAEDAEKEAALVAYRKGKR